MYTAINISEIVMKAITEMIILQISDHVIPRKTMKIGLWNFERGFKANTFTDLL